jgi:predicted acyltransferase
MENITPDKPKRLKSLDALRGFDMFFIFGGDSFFIALSICSGIPLFQWLAGQMEHVAWNGFHFYDNIFPMFLFIAGISFPFSLIKRLQLESKRKIYYHIILRGIILVLLGLVYNDFLDFDFAHQRYASVLGRIGLAWMFAALIFMNTGVIWRSVIVSAILLGYWLLLATVTAPDAPAGADGYSMTGSIVGYVDRLLLPGRLYLKVHDPEGILSTIPAIATALLGMFTGELILVKNHRITPYIKVLIMFIAGCLFLVIGEKWGLTFPVNKNLWTSSFVCMSAGLTLTLFAIFYLTIDVWGYSGWAFFFIVIGMNSIVAYMASHFISFDYTAHALFGGLIHFLPQNLQPLFTNIASIIVGWTFLYFLYKKKWFLKV